MDQQSSSNVPQQQQPVSPNLFLFQEIIIQTLQTTKKIIKTSPFDDLNPIQFVNINSNDKKQSLQPFHHYFLSAMANPKTRELACKNYQKLFRQNLVDQNSLPSQLISSILGACASTGSTTGSSMGSVSSTILQGQQSVHVAKLISVILIKTTQSIYQLTMGLNYLLQGTRSKNFSFFHVSLLQQVYQNCLVVHYRKAPLQKFISCYLNNLINEVQTHFDQKASNEMQFWQRKLKNGICNHQNIKGQGKFGLCFICQKQANNYDKNLLLPLCGMQCKYKLISLHEQSKTLETSNNMSFNIFNWLMDHIHSHNPAIYSLLSRQLSFVSFQEVKTDNIKTILIDLVKGLNITTSCSQIFRSILNRKQIIFNPQASQQLQMRQINIREEYKNPSIEINHLIHINFFQTINILHSSKPSYQKSHFIEHIVNPVLKNPTLLFKMYESYDCKFFQQDLLGEMLNIVRQYAMCGQFQSNSQTGLSSSSGSTGFKDGKGGKGSNDSIIGTGGTSLALGKMSTGIEFSPEKNVSQSITGGCRIIGIEGICGLLSMLIGLDKLDQKTENSKFGNSKNSISLKDEFEYQIDSFQLGSKRSLQNVMKIFNTKKPEKGIKKLKEFMPDITPQQIAILIRQNLDHKSSIKKRLRFTKQMVGQYFCSPNQQAIQVYNQFLKLLKIGDYKNIDVDHVWRIVLECFTLPKEAQQVERMLNGLTSMYFPYSKLQSQTAIYQFFFTAMMVQTSRNPNVKQSQKIKLSQFLNFCKLIQGGVDQQRATNVFQRLKINPLQNSYDWNQYETIHLKYLKWGTMKFKNNQIQNMMKQQDQSRIQIGSPKQNKQKMQEQKNKQSGQTQNIEEVQQIQKVQKRQEQPLQDQPSLQKSRESKTQQQQNKKQQVSQISVNNTSLSEGLSSISNVNSPTKKNHHQSFKNQKEALFNQLSLHTNEQQKYWKRYSFPYMQTFLEYVWEFVYMSIVNKSNHKGLMEAIVLYGKYQLPKLQHGFFDSLCKHYQKGSQQCYQILLKLGIYYGNYLNNQAWGYIIKLIYGIQQSLRNQNKPHLIDFQSIAAENNQSQTSVFTKNFLISSVKSGSDVIDKFFTRSQNLKIPKLKIFLEELCEFSSSQFKTDKNYNRQLFVLRHITQVIQYNIYRLQKDSFKQIWPVLERYYLNICLHPKRDIAMAAIDSYKQLLMKIIPLNYKIEQQRKIPFTLMLEVYFQVFERSNSFIRDLIVNILLNIVNPKLRDGWEVILKILEHADCQDQKIVMRIVGRIIDDVGLQNLKQLQQINSQGVPIFNLLLKLHQILLRQLKLANQNQHINIILKRVQEVANFINTIETWTDTLKSIKDIYKKTTNNDLLPLFYNLINKSTQMTYKMQLQDTRFDIYLQLYDMGVHFMQLKDRKTLENALKQSMKVAPQLIFQCIDFGEQGQKGFLNLWEFYLQSPNRLIFGLYIKKHLPYLLKQRQSLFNKTNAWEKQKINMINWLLKQLSISNPSDLIKTSSDLDKDFKIQLLQIQKDAQIRTTKLIQFSLPEREFHLKTMIHLMLLDCVKQSIPLSINLSKQNQQINGQIILSIVQKLFESYQTALKTNNLVVLRFFLFKNGFLNMSNKKAKKPTPQVLPGLHKQQIRSIQILLEYKQILNLEKNQKFIGICLEHFAKYQKLINFIHKDQTSSSNNLYELCKKDSNLWIINTEKSITYILKFFNKNNKLEKQSQFQHQSKLFFQETKKYLYKSCLKLVSYRIPSEMFLKACQMMEILTKDIIQLTIQESIE